MVEPLGLVSGPAARDLIAAGLGAPLDGGRFAATACRDPGGSVHPIQTGRGWPAAWSLPRTGWAGIDVRPAVMGIVNVTPDSFSDGGDAFDTSAAIARARQMLADGADIVDIGGESTRPHAAPVPPDEEQRRILPVITALARAGARISVDTRHADTMRRALDAGAAIVNDVSALSHDPNALAVVAGARCPVILMHMRGTPATMMHHARYRDVADEVVLELIARREACLAAGIDGARIAVDPGFGFAKMASQSRELLGRLPHLLNLPCPIVVGLSRKSFVGEMVRVANPADRDSGSLAAAMLALSSGATVLRVHDVAATAQAVRVWRAINDVPPREGERD